MKYPSFRPGRYGKYSWSNYENKPYEMLVIWAEYYWSSNSYQPFLNEIDSDSINPGDSGWSLLYGNTIVKCENTEFVLSSTETDEVLDRIIISQNNQGVDVEDRIIKGKKEIYMKIKSLSQEQSM